MTIDANRASFIKKEYRWDIKEDTSISDKNAREEEFPANVDPTTASQLATLIRDQNKKARLFSVKIDGIITLDDFLSDVPRYIPNLKDFGTDARTCRVISFSSSLNNGITEVRLHG
ncbi:MAG: hypothetical protein DI606_10565 [Sphingobium sp.]|uniref:hypothetical protein n=1 Tax=Sphingobium sp. TaxID=1912891 RepID=UPI000DB4D7C9|nr:hypothetical protein [Sphingobium sp.]PZU12115.1 MAG: hypothetical protein DI606_10565 [Sphingobium sp.]